MRTYFQAFPVGSRGFRTVAALLALSVCTPALSADFRGNLLSRARSMQSSNAPSGNVTSAFNGSLQTQVSNPTAGRTLGKRKLNSNAGSMAGQIQLDPNAGHTLGKRRLNSSSVSKLGQMQVDPNAGHTLGKRKLNSNSSLSGVGLPQPWQKSRVIAAPNGNTGITGAGLPAGAGSRVSNAARVGTPQPQQVMFAPLPVIPAALGALGYGIATAGDNKLPPAPTGGNFEGSIQAKADDPNAGHTLGKQNLDPNAGHTLGKRKKKFDPGSVAGKFDPNASTSVQLPNLPAGGATGGGVGGGTAPTNPAPPTTPAPAPQGKMGGGFPWGDVVVGTALGLANRPQVVYETPVYVPVAQAPVQQLAVAEAPAGVEPQVAQSAADLVLENIEQVAPATMLVGPAYRVTFRNQSEQTVGAFHVAIYAGTDGKMAADAPRAAMEIAGLQGGEVGEATLRLPAAAMKMASTNSRHSGFSHLVVAVDVTNDVAELDETNNVAIVERAALDAAAQ